MLKTLARSMLRSAAVAAVLAAAAMPARADLLETIKQRGQVTVATEARFAPFEFVEGGKIVGYGADLLREVMAKLPGVRVEQLDLPWQGILPGLAAGKFDFVATSVTVTKERAERYAFTLRFDDLTEFMSMEHSRAGILKVVPKVGDALLTNRRRPCLLFVEDTAGGVHDTLMAACDRYRYEGLGCTEPHDNCTDNLHAGMAAIGLQAPETPSPLNLFMNIPVHGDDTLSFDAPVSTPGSYVLLRAEMDLVVAFSACPQDILPINGVGHLPTEAHYRIEG